MSEGKGKPGPSGKSGLGHLREAQHGDESRGQAHDENDGGGAQGDAHFFDVLSVADFHGSSPIAVYPAHSVFRGRNVGPFQIVETIFARGH